MGIRICYGGVNVIGIVVGRATVMRCLVSKRDDCSLARIGLVWDESSWFEPGRQVGVQLNFVRHRPAFVVPEYGISSISSVWRLEFGDGS
jgi:hypothetical protein